MKRLLLASLVILYPSRVTAGPIEDAAVYVMRLSDRPNYTWVATIDDDARSYDIVGRTSKEGYTLAKMPAINSVRRRLGRSAADNEAEVIFRGHVDCVIATDEGWKSVAELPVNAEGVPVIGTSGLTLQSAALAGPLGTSVRGGRGDVRMLPAVHEKREPRA